MKDEGAGELPKNADKVISALLQHPTVRDAAKACRVSETTIWRYLQREDFQAKYRAAQRAIVDDAVGKLQAATSEAVDTLKKNLTCGNAFAENTAAQAILAQAFKGIELQELAARVEQLERLVEEQHGKGAKRW